MTSQKSIQWNQLSFKLRVEPILLLESFALKPQIISIISSNNLRHSLKQYFFEGLWYHKIYRLDKLWIYEGHCP